MLLTLPIHAMNGISDDWIFIRAESRRQFSTTGVSPS